MNAEDGEAPVPCTRKDYFNQLPEEILLKIFAYFTPPQLSKVIAPVCKQWWTLSKDASLWKELNFVIPSETTITVFCEVLLRCDLLHTFRIKSGIPIDCIILCFIQLRPQFLKEVDFAFCKGLNAEALSIIVSNCPQIRILSLEGCGLGIDYHCIQHIVTLKHLRSLNLSRCLNIDDLCIRTIATECRSLQLLNIDHVTRITDISICELAAKRQETLAHLFLDGGELTNESTIALSTCENLHTLCISCGELLTDTSMLALCSLQTLNWFKLGESPNITPEALETFFANPNLSSLKVLEFETSNIDNRGLHNLAKTCSNLKVLSLPCCYDVTNKGLKAVIDKCSELFWLDLTFVSQLTDESLTDIPFKLPKLKYLSLVECNDLTACNVLHLAQAMPHLKINFSLSDHFTHSDSEEEDEVKCTVNKSLNVSWTKRPEGFCSKLSQLSSYSREDGSLILQLQ